MAREGITQLLIESRNGNKDALDALMPLVFDELHRLAESYLRRERSDHTLQATALVNEAYLRLVDQRNIDWQNRAQFFGMAAQMMRRILVNYAEAHRASKRGGQATRLALDDAISFFTEQQDLDLLALNEAMNQLESLDAQQSKLVELRFFGGLTSKEIAEVLGISQDKVDRDWKTAKLFLRSKLSSS